MLESAAVNQAMLAQNQASAERSPGTAPGDTEKALERKAENFEAVFLSNMLKPMFEGLKTDGMFGGGHGEKMFRQELIKEYGSEIAESTDIGIADSVKQELLKAQEV